MVSQGMKILFIILLGLYGLLIVGCLPQPDKKTTRVTEKASMAAARVKSMEKEMDSGTFPLRLERSTVEDVVNYMGRSVDSMRRAPSGDLRYLAYKLGDGSELIFAMKPAPQGGLVLDHFRADW